MKNIIPALTLLFLSLIAKSATVDTVTTHSIIMNKDIKAVIITPDAYSPEKRMPVLYLLHGYSGNYADWVNNAPVIKELADYHQILIVCPDGNFSSWYFDSPIDSTLRYETYVAKELVNWVNAHYGTRTERTGRGICGLSMGGHGALYLAVKHPDVFGATCAISGGVDIRPFPSNWDIAKRLGTLAEHPENWEKNTVVNLVEKNRPDSLAVSLDCGLDDIFYSVNEQLHKKLVELKVPHDYTIRPGGHTWKYWNRAIKYQMQFFDDYFSRQ